MVPWEANLRYQQASLNAERGGNRSLRQVEGTRETASYLVEFSEYNKVVVLLTESTTKIHLNPNERVK
ncbi:hypothetical protein QR680_002837 [Steinernema hermaphroditum]|uniref:Uncharacterized protein n=1 Tax=Steinernema hermaphroditum TaxID=289476 RepID=A0AA39H4C7_9BILA|nr:hypothetical protein QR680_002837 [Steinernema hermaphroditum]